MRICLCLVLAASIAPSMSRTQAGARTTFYNTAPNRAQNPPQSTGITPEERTALLYLLDKTKEDFIQSIKGLSQAQWDFKPSPFSWSVAQTSEHIILAEGYIFSYSQQVLKAPAQERTGHTSAEEDNAVMSKVGDRSHRIMNPAAIAPRGRFQTPADAVAAFTVARDRSIEYVKTTKDDLRHHLTPDGTGGQLDAYEFLMLMAGHSGRHTVQIKEIEANPKYPATAVQ
jgi:hypothetical protein